MSNFTNHYEDDKRLDEMVVIQEGILGGVWKLMNMSVGTLFASLKPKHKNITDMSSIDDKTVSQVPLSLWSYLHKLLAADLLLWKKKSRDKGFVDKFIMKKKDVYVTELFSIKLDEDLRDEFGEVFDLTEKPEEEVEAGDSQFKYLINEFSQYKMSNGGFVSLISVSDPYTGESDDYQVVGKIRERLQNLKYYVAISDKAEKWFSDKTGMLFNNFLVTRMNTTQSDMLDDAQAMASTFDENIPQERGKKPQEELDRAPADGSPQRSGDERLSGTASIDPTAKQDNKPTVRDDGEGDGGEETVGDDMIRQARDLRNVDDEPKDDKEEKDDEVSDDEVVDEPSATDVPSNAIELPDGEKFTFKKRMPISKEEYDKYVSDGDDSFKKLFADELKGVKTHSLGDDKFKLTVFSLDGKEIGVLLNNDNGNTTLLYDDATEKNLDDGGVFDVKDDDAEEAPEDTEDEVVDDEPDTEAPEDEVVDDEPEEVVDDEPDAEEAPEDTEDDEPEEGEGLSDATQNAIELPDGNKFSFTKKMKLSPEEAELMASNKKDSLRDTYKDELKGVESHSLRDGDFKLTIFDVGDAKIGLLFSTKTGNTVLLYDDKSEKEIDDFDLSAGSGDDESGDKPEEEEKEPLSFDDDDFDLSSGGDEEEAPKEDEEKKEPLSFDDEDDIVSQARDLLNVDDDEDTPEEETQEEAPEEEEETSDEEEKTVNVIKLPDGREFKYDKKKGISKKLYNLAGFSGDAKSLKRIFKDELGKDKDEIKKNIKTHKFDDGKELKIYKLPDSEVAVYKNPDTDKHLLFYTDKTEDALRQAGVLKNGEENE